jgi:hypothetical protein
MFLYFVALPPERLLAAVSPAGTQTAKVPKKWSLRVMRWAYLRKYLRFDGEVR